MNDKAEMVGGGLSSSTENCEDSAPRRADAWTDRVSVVDTISGGDHTGRPTISTEIAKTASDGTNRPAGGADHLSSAQQPLQSSTRRSRRSSTS